MLCMIVMMVTTVWCDIQILSSSPPLSLVEEGGTVSLSCVSTTPWFLCVWTTPLSYRVCSVQESHPVQVCGGDSRITVQGGDTHCGVTVSNVSSQDWGGWRCLVQEGDQFTSDRREVELQVGRKAGIELEYIKDYRIDNSKEYNDSERVIVVTEGENIDITCSARHAYPRPSFTWSSPAYTTTQQRNRRVRKYLSKPTSDDDRMRNQSIQDIHTFDPSSHTYSSSSVLHYSANMSHTNTTITCMVEQVDMDMADRVVYSQAVTVRVIVEPLPMTPAYTMAEGERVGMVTGVIISSIILCLVLVLVIIFTCRRHHRDKTRECQDNQNSDYQLETVWRTQSSGTWDPPGDSMVPHSGTRISHSENRVTPSDSESVPENDRPVTRSTKTVSDSDSYQTERDVGEVDHIGVSLRPAPSLHETHFSSSNDSLPLTILHPAGIPVHLPGVSSSYLDQYWRKQSSTLSEGAAFGRDSYSLSSRPVSALDLYSHYPPQRISTPTCPGSKNSLSLFHCNHACFSETDVTEDTIEEMEEEDLDSLNKLVRQGLDVETDWSSSSSEDRTNKLKKPTGVTAL